MPAPNPNIETSCAGFEPVGKSATSLSQFLTEPPTPIPFGTPDACLADLTDWFWSGEVVYFTAPTEAEARQLALITALSVGMRKSGPVLAYTGGVRSELFTKNFAEVLSGVPNASWDDDHPSTRRERLSLALQQLESAEILICDSRVCLADWYSLEPQMRLRKNAKLVVILEPESITWEYPTAGYRGPSLLHDLGKQLGVPVVLFNSKAAAEPDRFGADTWLNLTEEEFVVAGKGGHWHIQVLRDMRRNPLDLIVPGAALQYR